MKIVYKNPSDIPFVLNEYILNINAFFVFPSDIDCNSWSEWCVLNKDISGVSCVPVEKFIAWDKFKSTYLCATQKEKTSIPSILRKVFVNNIIKQNIEQTKKGNPIFTSIINQEYCEEGYSFVDWISKNISSLNLWYNKFVLLNKKEEELDNEDKDYLKLYLEYKSFLDKNNLFEPAWLNAQIQETEKTFIIFYPEQLEDFDEYLDSFENSNNVILIKLPEETELNNKLYFFSDARTELRRVCLYIRELLLEKKVLWNQIALHVPELNIYKPYLKRELKKYCIPFVIRAGDLFTINSAASVFEQIKACKDDNFSYDSVRSLLLNEYIPWKDKFINESLIREGNKFHCVCSYQKQKDLPLVDTWIESLNNNENQRELIFYKTLKNDINKICNSKSFFEIQEGWFIFKNHFLVEDEFSVNANNILSRCIEELDELIEIEKNYIIPLELSLNNYYNFFINELKTKTYRTQEEINGISVFDYKLAACSAYKYNIVINCSQKKLSVSYKPLDFLNNEKRKELGIFDKDYASKCFVYLYNKFNTEKEQTTIFTCAEQGFSGFAIPYNLFEIENEKDPLSYLDEKDFIKNESEYFINNTEEKVKEVSFLQKEQFDNWAFSSDALKEECKYKKEYFLDESVKNKIYYLLCKKRNKNEADSDKIIISQSDMEKFFPCPRKWLYKDVLKLKEDTLDLKLLQSFDIGTLNHKILELFFTYYKENNLLIPETQDDGTFGEKEEEIKTLLNDSIIKAIHSNEMGFKSSPLVIEVLSSYKNNLYKILINFIRVFCSKEKGFGGQKIYSLEEWFNYINDDLDYGLIGRFDSVFIDDDGNISIVDFKNAAKPVIKNYYADTQGKIKKFQIAMYVSLWNLCKDNSLKVSNASIAQIASANITNIISESKKDATIDDYESTLNSFNLYVSKFSEKIKTEQLNPVIDNNSIYEDLDVYKNCIACDFKGICRSCYTVASKKIKKSN